MNRNQSSFMQSYPSLQFDFGNNDIMRDLLMNPQPINTMSPLANRFWQQWMGSRTSPEADSLLGRDQFDPSIPSTSAISEQAELEPVSSSAEEETSAALDASETILEASEAAEGPVGWAREAGQIGGQFLNMGIGSLQSSLINQQLQTTLVNSHGIGVTEIAQAKASGDVASLNLQNAIGSVGAFLGGPIGVLLGRGIASFIPTGVSTDVANSNYGKFDPQSLDVSTSQSQSSADLDPTNNGDATSS